MDLIGYIKQDFERRKNTNQRYSMRAYAKHLEVSPGHLSKLFNGVNLPNVSTLKHIIEKLKVTHEEKQKLLEAYTESKETLKSKRKVGKEHFFTPETAGEWPFETWLEIAIFLYVENFSEIHDIEKLAIFLDTPPHDILTTLKKLTDKKLLYEESGHYHKMVQNVSAKATTPSSFVNKNLQFYFLEMARYHLQNTDTANRLNGTLTFTLNKKLLPQIKRKVEIFLKNINGLAMAKGGRPTSMYNLTVSLYPLLKKDF